ncbi:EF-hand domain [Dillenia turbinata]|uniref:EF-hand domain n=1 Tax=Dillenia turbinata TaxID=194707 RepID=A0AAN8Z7Z9_9MAGN
MENVLENAISKTTSYFVGTIIVSVVVPILDVFFPDMSEVHKFIVRSLLSVQTGPKLLWGVLIRSEEKSPEFELPSQSVCSNEKAVVDNELQREEMEMLMDRLGIFLDSKGEKLQQRLNPQTISTLFEEKEPSLEEVNEAFRVFDENKDGFIDAEELQRVMTILGHKEGSKIADCKKMIRAYDENGDGRIDFHEFLKFMEHSFS